MDEVAEQGSSAAESSDCRSEQAPGNRQERTKEEGNMSEGLNRVTLIGNLGQDPELRYTQSSQAVLTLRMATTESYFDEKSKERKEHTEWHTVTLWGKRGEALSKILSKGARLCVEGRNQTRSWEDKQGNKRYSTEINAKNVILLGGGSNSRQEAGRGRQDDGYVQNGGGFDAGQPGDYSEGVDENIPF